MKKRAGFLGLICMISVLAVTVISSVRVNAFTESGECGNGITWHLDGDTGVLTVSGSGEMSDYAEHQPKYDGTQAPWSPYVYRIKSIVVEEGVTYIGDYAFFRCIYAVSVSLPTSLTEIGDFAFARCASLERAELPTGLERIGENAFFDCKKLTISGLSDKAETAGNSFDGMGTHLKGCNSAIFSESILPLIAAIPLFKKKRR